MSERVDGKTLTVRQQRQLSSAPTRAAEMFIRHQTEIDSFLADNVYTLNQAGFDWNLPRTSDKKGMLIANVGMSMQSAVVLTPRADLVLMDRKYEGWEEWEYKLPPESSRRYLELVDTKVRWKLSQLERDKEERFLSLQFSGV